MDKYQVALQAILSCNSLAAAHMIAQEALRKAAEDSLWLPRDQVEVQNPMWNLDVPANQLHAFEMAGLDVNDYNGINYLKSTSSSDDDDDISPEKDVTSGLISD